MKQPGQIEFPYVPQPEWDERLGGWIMKRDQVWIVSVSPMLYNDRVCLTHVEEYPWFYVGGWCYEPGAAAYLAAAAWDPNEMHRPVGWKKEAAAREDCRTFGPVALMCKECLVGEAPGAGGDC